MDHSRMLSTVGPSAALRTRTRKTVCKPRTNDRENPRSAYMVHEIAVMRTKSLQTADKTSELFADDGHGPGAT